MSDDLDFYDLLGVSEDASQEEIRNGFRDQVREYHPDLNDDPRAPAQFTALKKAYDTLADAKERDAYDRMGHDQYVKKRISGLPSPDDWQMPDRENGSADAATSDDPEPRAAGQESAANSTVGSGSAADEAGGSTDGTARTSTDVGGFADADASSTFTSNEGSSRAGRGSTVDPRSGDYGGSTGTGTARDPDTVWTPGDPIDKDSTEGSPEEPEEPEQKQPLRESARVWLRSVIGWPLIVGADLLFVAGMVQYVVANLDGVDRLLGVLRDAGGSPGAILAALGERYGIATLPQYVATDLSQPFPLGSVSLILGMAFLPSVYFFLVRWTRKSHRSWQPTYLYILGALAPVLGLFATLVADPPGLYVEAFLYVLTPGVTMGSLLFFGQIKPRLARAVRRWRYRLRS